ncbi:MAG TPA: hypothetical protein VIL47_00755 [Candidatus Bipolaricaulota bacterium]
MAFSRTYRDGFACPIALQTLQDLVRWLALRQSWEETIKLSDCQSVARQWGVFPHENKIFVQVVAGLNGQQMLLQFPGLSTLPVMPGDRIPPRSIEDPCHSHIYYFGPFAEEFHNL